MRKKKKKQENILQRLISTLFLQVLFSVFSAAQVPAGYYSSASGLSGTALQEALHNIIDNHTVLSYTPGLWDAVQLTDARDDGTVWDMYSDNPSGTNPYNYTFVINQCGNYNSEADCYNREHSFPKSWFDDASPMYTDLNHIFPTDGYVNNRRGNYAFGETNNPTWTSLNGSKVGPSSVAGYTGTIFEPIDEYKGDLARAILYMAVRYYGEDGSWTGGAMTDGAQPLEWALDLLLQWHEDDPVSQKEIDRNNEVFKLQDNRNPFIDFPDYANNIWNTTGIEERGEAENGFIVYPNPTSQYLRFTLHEVRDSEIEISIYSIAGTLIRSFSTDMKSENLVNVQNLERGIYILKVRSGKTIYRETFIKL